MERLDVELTDENIDRVCEFIKQMRNDMVQALELQDQLRTFLKNNEAV